MQNFCCCHEYKNKQQHFFCTRGLFPGQIHQTRSKNEKILYTVCCLSVAQNQCNPQSFMILCLILLDCNCVYTIQFLNKSYSFPSLHSTLSVCFSLCWGGADELGRTSTPPCKYEWIPRSQIIQPHRGTICMNDHGCVSWVYAPIRLLWFYAHSKTLPSWSLKYVDEWLIGNVYSFSHTSLMLFWAIVTIHFVLLGT